VISSVICIPVFQKVHLCGERQQVVTERHRVSRSERGQAVVDSKGESGCGGGRPSTVLRILFSKSPFPV